MNQPTTSYAIRTQDRALVAALASEGCAGLWTALRPLLVDGSGGAAPLGVVIDFTDVTYVDSVNIAALLSVRNQTEAMGRRFVVANLKPSIRAIFAVLKLDRMFALDYDLTRALEHVVKS
jgi:anti-anti-sigma factor